MGEKHRRMQAGFVLSQPSHSWCSDACIPPIMVGVEAMLAFSLPSLVLFLA